MDLSPTASCFLMIASISRSSIAFNCSGVISFFSRFARASFSADERNRLPTWSARNGGLVRCILTTLLYFCFLLLAPDFFSQFHDHPQLRPLLVLGENIAFFGGGKAALRRQAKLIERGILGRLVDAALDRILGLQLAAFGGDEAEHYALLALRNEPQGFEAARPIGIVFEEITVEIGITEQLLRDELVATRGDEGGAEVASARVHGDGHIVWLARQRLVSHLRIDRRQLARIVAAFTRMLALPGIAHHRPGRVVHL